MGVFYGEESNFALNLIGAGFALQTKVLCKHLGNSEQLICTGILAG
jgi:hypothetical protein